MKLYQDYQFAIIERNRKNGRKKGGREWRKKIQFDINEHPHHSRRLYKDLLHFLLNERQ